MQNVFEGQGGNLTQQMGSNSHEERKTTGYGMEDSSYSGRQQPYGESGHEPKRDMMSMMKREGMTAEHFGAQMLLASTGIPDSPTGGWNAPSAMTMEPGDAMDGRASGMPTDRLGGSGGGVLRVHRPRADRRPTILARAAAKL